MIKFLDAELDTPRCAVEITLISVLFAFVYWREKKEATKHKKKWIRQTAIWRKATMTAYILDNRNCL